MEAAGPTPRALRGRSQELERATRALGDADGGRLRLLFVSGEPGIGKTRLAEEIATRAEAAGALSLWGRGWAESEGMPPLWPWLQVVRGLAAAMDDEALQRAVGAGAAAVAVALPELGARLGRRDRGVALAPSEAHFRLFEAIGDLVDHLGRSRPLVIVLDDAHGCDIASLRVLRFLARDPRPLRALVVITHRDAEPEGASTVATPLHQLAAEACSIRLPLEGLSAEAVRDQMADLEGFRRPEHLSQAVHASTGGNPLLVLEATRALVGEDGAAPDLDDRLSDPFRAVHERRLQRLSPLARDLVDAGSVLESHFRIGVLRRVLPLVSSARQTGEIALLDALDEAVRLRLVVADGDPVGGFAFVHDLTRTAVYGGLSPSRRALLHRAAAETLAAVLGADTDAHVRTLAFHAYEGLAAGVDPERAVEWARRSARQAALLGDHATAADNCERALRAHEFLAGAEDRTRIDRACILVDLGRARIRLGHPDAHATLAQAADLVRPRLAENVEARLVLADVALSHGLEVPPDNAEDLRSAARYDEALRALGTGDPALRIHLLARQAPLLARSRGQLRAQRIALEALAEAERLGDPSALCEALDAHHLTHWNDPDCEARLAVASRLRERALERGDAATEQLACTWRAVDLLDAGRVAEADAEIEKSERLAGALEDAARAHPPACLRVVRAYMCGRLDESAALAERALAIGERAGVREAPVRYQQQMYALHYERGQLAELDRVQRRTTRFLDELPGLQAATMLASLRLGRAEDARKALRDVVADEMSGVFADLHRLASAWVIAVTAFDLRASEVAETLYRILRPHAHRNLLADYGAGMAAGSLWRGCAMMASLVGRDDDADDHFERALAFNEGMGAPTFVLQTKLHWGQALVRRSSASARERGMAMLEAVVRGASELGLATLAAQARATLDEARRGDPAEPAGFWVRRGAVWEITFEGVTVHLTDTKGVRYIALLLAHPGSDLHSTELVALVHGDPGVPGRPSDTGSAGGGLGDAGLVLDERALREYRRRLDELRGELHVAEAANDLGRATRAREQIDWLAREIAAATGLGGRRRVAKSHAERCRLAVCQRVKSTLRHCERVHPALADHLRRHLSTGAFCRYAPEQGWSWVVG